MRPREWPESGRPAKKPVVLGETHLKTPALVISPRSPGQLRYLQTLATYDLVFCTGPAGTGKTYLAVAQAVSMLGRIIRIILSRPAIEAGEKIGFLPGDMRDKVDPYLRPLYDALHDMLPAAQVARKLASGEIEIAPLAFMRGRTVEDAFVILDEAQNATANQLKMFLARLGCNSRMVGGCHSDRPASWERIGRGPDNPSTWYRLY